MTVHLSGYFDTFNMKEMFFVLHETDLWFMTYNL